MSKSLENMTLGGRLLLGGLLAGIGLLTMAAVTGMGPFEPDVGPAPEWVGVLAGALFVLVGVLILSQGTPLQAATNFAVGPLVMVGLLTMLHWIAFGPGVRECSGSFSIPFLSTSGPVGDLECRLAFGYGAVLFDGVLAGMFMSHAADRWLEGTPHRVVDVFSKGILLLVLAPFVFLVLAISLVKALGARLFKRA